MIKLMEQHLDFDGDSIVSESGDPPFTLSYSVSYGDDEPFINKLIWSFDTFETAWHEWSMFKFTEDQLDTLSEIFINTYAPPYDEPLSIELIFLDGNDCRIASSTYDCEFV